MKIKTSISIMLLAIFFFSCDTGPREETDEHEANNHEEEMVPGEESSGENETMMAPGDPSTGETKSVKSADLSQGVSFDYFELNLFVVRDVMPDNMQDGNDEYYVNSIITYPATSNFVSLHPPVVYDSNGTKYLKLVYEFDGQYSGPAGCMDLGGIKYDSQKFTESYLAANNVVGFLVMVVHPGNGSPKKVSVIKNSATCPKPNRFIKSGM